MTVTSSVRTPPVVLTVAGTDPTGGAGVAADLTTFAALGCHGTAVITAVTAQDSAAVAGVHRVPTAFVALQLDRLVADLAPVATKTGMLADAEVVAVVAEAAAAGRLGRLVVDPVLVAGDGRALFGVEVTEAYQRVLLPVAEIITPNAREAAALTGHAVDTVDDAIVAALTLAERGPSWVVVTGGDLATDRPLDRQQDGERDEQRPGEAVDVLVESATGAVHELRRARVATTAVRGTGCTFAAAIVAHLAAGATVPDAVAAAKHFVHDALVRGRHRHQGRGPGSIPHDTPNRSPGRDAR